MVTYYKTSNLYSYKHVDFDFNKSTVISYFNKYSENAKSCKANVSMYLNKFRGVKN